MAFFTLLVSGIVILYPSNTVIYIYIYMLYYSDDSFDSK